MCKTCPINTYSAVGSASCTACNAASFSLTGSSSCTSCSSGSFWNPNTGICTLCPSDSTSIGSTDRCNCSQGLFWNSTAATCSSCPTGLSSPGSTDYCTCSSGNFWNKSTWACQQCASGYYSSIGRDICSICPSNTYSAIGASFCTPCASGGYSPPGSTSCMYCPSGQYPNTTLGSCQICPIGYYSNSSQDSCTKCPPYQYSTAGSAACTACESGVKFFLDGNQAIPSYTGTPPTFNNTNAIFVGASKHFIDWGNWSLHLGSCGFSVKMRIEWTNYNSWARVIDFNSGDLGVGDMFITLPGTSSQFRFQYKENGVEQQTNMNSILLNRIYDITVVYNSLIGSKGRVQIWMNNSVAVTNTAMTHKGTDKNYNRTYIGRSSYPVDAYLGAKIYYMKIYNRALTDVEVVNPCNEGSYMASNGSCTPCLTGQYWDYETGL